MVTGNKAYWVGSDADGSDGWPPQAPRASARQTNRAPMRPIGSPLCPVLAGHDETCETEGNREEVLGSDLCLEGHASRSAYGFSGLSAGSGSTVAGQRRNSTGLTPVRRAVWKHSSPHPYRNPRLTRWKASLH